MVTPATQAVISVRFPSLRFQGKLYKDGKWWLAEVPIFAVMTQRRTRAVRGWQGKSLESRRYNRFSHVSCA